MTTALELFFVTSVTGGFQYIRREIGLTEEQRDPDLVATEYIRYLFTDSSIIAHRQRYILHSTSWRYELPHRIILTYIVYADTFQLRELFPGYLDNAHIAVVQTENPQTPRPVRIVPAAVLSHALRHLAFLIATDSKNVFRAVISKETITTFLQIDTQLAGRIAN